MSQSYKVGCPSPHYGRLTDHRVETPTGASTVCRGPLDGHAPILNKRPASCAAFIFVLLLDCATARLIHPMARRGAARPALTCLPCQMTCGRQGVPNYRRVFVPGATWFFTVNLLLRRDNDLLIRHVGILRHAVRRVHRLPPFVIDAWVVLPEHMHCVWMLPPGDMAYPLLQGVWRSTRNWGRFT